MSHPLLVLLGPTASGKTRLAVRLADRLNAEIISADSRQVFKRMDIGTGKDLNEYMINGKAINYHLINIKDAGQKYNVNEFKEDFYRVFSHLTNKKIVPILCGGTGMYIHSLLQDQPYTAVPVNDLLRTRFALYSKEELKKTLEGYPAKLTAHADLSSSKRMIRAIEVADYLVHHELPVQSRPVINPFVAGLLSDVSMRRAKVIQRLETRFDEGLIEEVQLLLDSGVDKETLEFYGLEYKFISAYIHGECTLMELKERLAIAICQFAKRQMTFFRKMEKDGVEINWFDTSLSADSLAAVIDDSFKKHLDKSF